jgi:hypothetical protein
MFNTARIRLDVTIGFNPCYSKTDFDSCHFKAVPKHQRDVFSIQTK